VILDLATRLAAGDLSGARERIRFFRSPRQQWLLRRLQQEGGLLLEIGRLVAHLPRNVAGTEGKAIRREVERIGGRARRYLHRITPVGRIP
jgi:hypothetical protein